MNYLLQYANMCIPNELFASICEYVYFKSIIRFNMRIFTQVRHKSITEGVAPHVTVRIRVFGGLEERHRQDAPPGHPAVLAVIDDGKTKISFRDVGPPKMMCGVKFL